MVSNIEYLTDSGGDVAAPAKNRVGTNRRVVRPYEQNGGAALRPDGALGARALPPTHPASQSWPVLGRPGSGLNIKH